MNILKKVLVFVGGFFVVIMCIGFFLDSESSSTSSTEQTETSTETSTKQIESSSKTETPSVPKEYTSALKKAEIYLETMPYSKKGLYDQLTSEYGEQFSVEAAQYAIDNVKTDYKENALKSAINYQEVMHMSSAAIYDQLTSEYGDQFTPEEVQYAIDNLPK